MRSQVLLSAHLMRPIADLSYVSATYASRLGPAFTPICSRSFKRITLFILPPGMGAGIASWKTPRPAFNCVKSLVSHIVFGLGMYLAGLAMASLRPLSW